MENVDLAVKTLPVPGNFVKNGDFFELSSYFLKEGEALRTDFIIDVPANRYAALEIPRNRPIGRVQGEVTTCEKLGYPVFPVPGFPFLTEVIPGIWEGEMAIKITTLSENTAPARGILAEWGLSILVEADDKTILFDCGQSISVVSNALKLGIDLSKIDVIVLSHGHYDHTGGLRDVLRSMRKEIQIVAHPDVWQSKYVKRTGEKSHRYIGIPFQSEELESQGASFHFISKPVWLFGKIATVGEIEMNREPEQVESDLSVRKGEAFVPSP